MELGGKLLNFLRIKTQFLERLQSVNVVDGAAHTQKDDVESNGGSLENVAEMFCAVLLRRSAGFEAWCPHHTSQKSRVGQNHIPIRFIYDIFGREITKYTVIYGVYVRF